MFYGDLVLISSTVTNEVVFDALQFVIDINIIVNTSPAPGHLSRLGLNRHNPSETRRWSHLRLSSPVISAS